MCFLTHGLLESHDIFGLVSPQCPRGFPTVRPVRLDRYIEISWGFHGWMPRPSGKRDKEGGHIGKAF